MANDYELTIDIEASPDAVWAVIGDPASVPRWFPKYVKCDVQGEVRILKNADGGELVERMYDRDDARRRYAYTVLSGPPLKSHAASFEVVEAPGGSRVIWKTAAEFIDPAIDTEERLGPAQRDGLERLKAICEGTAPGA